MESREEFMERFRKAFEWKDGDPTLVKIPSHLWGAILFIRGNLQPEEYIKKAIEMQINFDIDQLKYRLRIGEYGMRKYCCEQKFKTEDTENDAKGD